MKRRTRKKRNKRYVSDIVKAQHRLWDSFEHRMTLRRAMLSVTGRVPRFRPLRRGSLGSLGWVGYYGSIVCSAPGSNEKLEL